MCGSSEGAVLFLAKDVAEWIEYAQNGDGAYQVSAMLRTVDDDEKTTLALPVGSLDIDSTNNTTDSGRTTTKNAGSES